MAVDKKERALLQDNWDNAEATSGVDLPDGTYQFEIKKKVGDKVTGFQWSGGAKRKPTFKTQLKVKGGAEEYVGTELEVNDNLETAENMGWFKKKLNRLNVELPEDIGDVIDGTIAEAMIGKVFEGQVKTKNDFINVYVNRLMGEADEEAGESEDEDEDKPAKKAKDDEEESSDIEVGTRVAWGDKEGEVLEILEDEKKARVQTDDEKKYRVDLDKLEVVKAEKEEEEEEEEKPKGKKKGEEEEEESEGTDEFEVPEPDDVEEMAASDVKKALKALDFDAAELKQPRAVLKAFCALAHDEDAELELSEVTALAGALDITPKKGESIKVTRAALSKAVQKRLG
jgi:hypothetical protein